MESSEPSVQYGALIGIINVGNTHCCCSIFRTENGEVLSEHELKLKQIVHKPGWMEYDPGEIWTLTQECMETACKNLMALQISLKDIVAVGICTARGTTMAWDAETGAPFYNAIGWADCRTAPILKSLLSSIKNNVNYLRDVTGQPLSTCFSALKMRWLEENGKGIKEALKDSRCMFGTLDSWLLWNLTGGAPDGIHATDITNACFTGLMNIKTLQWDKRLCNYYHVSMETLPEIKTNCEIYGSIASGPLKGLPIASSIGDQPASLLGHFCFDRGQIVCSIDENCFVMMNTAAELVESNHGLVTSVGYQLGPEEPPIYCLEGALSNAGASVLWLREGLKLNAEANVNDNVVDVLATYFGESSLMTSSGSSSMFNLECGAAAKRCEVTLVPAFHGLYAPYWRYDAKGILLGLTSQTTAENVTQAAYEATGFQIHECLEAFKLDTIRWENFYHNFKEKLIFAGKFAENTTFVQFVTDIVGWLFEKPQTLSPNSLGAMIAAGVTMNLIDIKHVEDHYKPPSDCYTPLTTQKRRDLLYRRWEYAVKKCMTWNNYETFEDDVKLFAKREYDSDRNIRHSIPGSFFITSAFVLLLVAKYFYSRHS